MNIFAFWHTTKRPPRQQLSKHLIEALARLEYAAANAQPEVRDEALHTISQICFEWRRKAQVWCGVAKKLRREIRQLKKL
jgi:hypothetical protein